MAQNNTERYIDVLPALVKSINDRHLDSIGMSPSQVTVENSLVVFATKYRNTLSSERPLKQGLPYKKGDRVRIEIKKKTFDKSYLQNFMDAIFTIKKIVYRAPVYVYNLVDHNGYPLDKSYYAEELVRVYPSTDLK